MKNKVSIADLVSTISTLPLKCENLSELSILKNSINLFGSLMLQRVKSLLLDRYPDSDFSGLNENSSILDIHSMVNTIKNLPEEDYSLFNLNSSQKSNISSPYLLGLTSTKVGENILSVGVDIESMNNFPEDIMFPSGSSFRLKTFSPREVAYASTKPSSLQTLLGIFCAKEAVIKCWSKIDILTFRDIEIIHDHSGSPLCNIYKNKENNPKISISHTDNYACAFAVLINP